MLQLSRHIAAMYHRENLQKILAGSTRNRSIQDHIFNVRQIIEKIEDHNSGAIACLKSKFRESVSQQ